MRLFSTALFISTLTFLASLNSFAKENWTCTNNWDDKNEIAYQFYFPETNGAESFEVVRFMGSENPHWPATRRNTRTSFTIHVPNEFLTIQVSKKLKTNSGDTYDAHVTWPTQHLNHYRLDCTKSQENTSAGPHDEAAH